MTRLLGRRTLPLRWFAGLAALGFAAAGCTTPIKERHPSREELTVSSTAALGRIVADDEGRTVYMFEKDQSDESYCHGACESVWPPVTTNGTPKVDDGTAGGKVTLLRREDGLMQVVYNGHPLYYYQGDTSSADTHGQEQDQFGAQWYALTPTGGPAHHGTQEGGSYGS